MTTTQNQTAQTQTAQNQTAQTQTNESAPTQTHQHSGEAVQPSPRMNALGTEIGGKLFKRLTAVQQVVTEVMPESLLNLVDLRVSQINGCANAANRLNLIVQNPAGEYRAGMFG